MAKVQVFSAVAAEGAAAGLRAVQVVARVIRGGTRNSIPRLVQTSAIPKDTVAAYRRLPGTDGARRIPPARLRLMALLIAAQRQGVLDDLLADAGRIETALRKHFPNDVE